MSACRECHREDYHNLSCSHVRYEGRTEITESDSAAPDFEAATPYCPGPEVACYYGTSPDPTLCAHTSGPCYYGTGA